MRNEKTLEYLPLVSIMPRIEGEGVGGGKVLGGRGCWEGEDAGRERVLEGRGSWEGDGVGRARVLGGRWCWDGEGAGWDRMKRGRGRELHKIVDEGGGEVREEWCAVDSKHHERIRINKQ